jgi:hypothetical protein
VTVSATNGVIVKTVYPISCLLGPPMHTRSADEKTANAPSPASPSDSFDRGTGKPEAPKSSKLEGFKLRWPATLQWVPDNATWAKIKPTIRSTVAAWLSAVLFLIPQVEIFMGQASFLILMSEFPYCFWSGL